MMKKVKLYAAGLLILAVAAYASNIIYNALLVNETALCYNKTYSLDLQSLGINALSAQATYSSATIPSATFTDGTQSTGAITVVNYAGLSTASATNSITVVTTAGLSGANLSLPGFSFREGLDWTKKDTASGTAVSLLAALQQVPFFSMSRAGSVIYTTAPVGSIYNTFQMTSSTPTALAVASPYFTGGQDNATVRINGVTLLQGRDFTAATSNAATATSLKSAINASSALSQYIRASAGGAVVFSTSILTGSLYNFDLQSSTSSLSVFASSMKGGTNPADTLNSSTLHMVGHGLATGLPVIFSTAGAAVLGGLSNQSTYFVSVVDADNIKLSVTSSGAVAGLGITITSTNTQQTANTFTLAPTSNAGVPSFKWQVSLDNSSWFDLSASSVTVSSYSNPPASTFWSFGYIGTRYLRLNVTAPTAGGLSLSVRVIGTN